MYNLSEDIIRNFFNIGYNKFTGNHTGHNTYYKVALNNSLIQQALSAVKGGTSIFE